MTRRTLAAWLAALFAGTMAGAAMADAPRPAYAVGQVWRYRTRSDDPGSLLKIQQIEAGSALGPIYHISIIGVRLGQDRRVSEIAHTPVSRQTLDGSVTEMAASDARFPDAAPGIAQWRAASGGVFTLSVAEIVEVIDKTTRDHGPR